jgi:putative FmdB family regulatory protein
VIAVVALASARPRLRRARSCTLAAVCTPIAVTHERKAMPTYEFHCRACDRIFELEQSISACEEHLKKHDLHCPKCQSVEVEQQVAFFEVETAKKS